MRSHFPAFYRIHQDCIIKNFDNCYIVFDANALLDIYRLPKESTEQIFSALTHYKGQIKVPYHVAQEYNQNINRVLLTQLNNIENAKSNLIAFKQKLDNHSCQPYISKKTNRQLKSFQNSITKDFNEQEQYIKNQLLYGNIQNKMAELLEGCVLEPFTDDEIKKIEDEGVLRYKNHISPGWKEADKGDNRYGDLIVWKEILRLAKEQNRSVMYVTNDQKDDWMQQEKGMKICPQYDLLNEFFQTVNNSQLWFQIFTLDRFLQFINERNATIISKKTVNQVRESLLEPTGDTYVDNINSLSASYNMQDLISLSKKIKDLTYMQHELSEIYKFSETLQKFQNQKKLMDSVSSCKPKMDTAFGDKSNFFKSSEIKSVGCESSSLNEDSTNSQKDSDKEFEKIDVETSDESQMNN